MYNLPNYVLIFMKSDFRTYFPCDLPARRACNTPNYVLIFMKSDFRTYFPCDLPAGRACNAPNYVLIFMKSDFRTYFPYDLSAGEPSKQTGVPYNPDNYGLNKFQSSKLPFLSYFSKRSARFPK